jgi:polyisoprenoid-binding protein YceI
MRLVTSVALLIAATLAQAQTPPASTAPIPKGEYSLDKAHASLIFRVDHMTFSTFTGRFTQYQANLAFDPQQPAASSVRVTIDPRSVSSDNAPDGFLQMLGSDKDWLNGAEHPEMKFASQRVEVVSGRNLRVHGLFTMRGITKPLVLEARFNGGYAGHPFDPAARIGFSAKGKLKRSDYGLSAGIPSPTNQFGVSDEVEVILEAEFNGPPLKVARQ